MELCLERSSQLTGRQIRLNRLFSKGENAVVVAIDHGEFDGPIPGMIDVPQVIKKVDSGVSGVLLSPGMLAHCAHAFDYKGSPLAIVRLNWSSHLAFHWGYNDAESVEAMSPEDAMRAGADVVLVCLALKTGSEARDAANVASFCKLTNDAKRLGLPVIGEVFPACSESISEEDMHDQVITGCRIAAELGADLIKTFHTHNFKAVTESCPIPVLGLGAKKKPRQIDALELAERIVADGGRGVVFGRNALQVSDPAAFQRALCDVVKKRTPAAQAAMDHWLQD